MNQEAEIHLNSSSDRLSQLAKKTWNAKQHERNFSAGKKEWISEQNRPRKLAFGQQSKEVAQINVPLDEVKELPKAKAEIHRSRQKELVEVTSESSVCSSNKLDLLQSVRPEECAVPNDRAKVGNINLESDSVFDVTGEKSRISPENSEFSSPSSSNSRKESELLRDGREVEDSKQKEKDILETKKEKELGEASLASSEDAGLDRSLNASSERLSSLAKDTWKKSKITLFQKIPYFSYKKPEIFHSSLARPNTEELNTECPKVENNVSVSKNCADDRLSALARIVWSQKKHARGKKIFNPANATHRWIHKNLADATVRSSTKGINNKSVGVLKPSAYKWNSKESNKKSFLRRRASVIIKQNRFCIIKVDRKLQPHGMVSLFCKLLFAFSKTQV